MSEIAKRSLHGWTGFGAWLQRWWCSRFHRGAININLSSGRYICPRCLIEHCHWD